MIARSNAQLDTPVAASKADWACTFNLELGHWALQFTPHVACMLDATRETHQQQAVLMEVSASLRLWGGMPSLLATLRCQGESMGLAHLATGSTGLVALARLHSRKDDDDDDAACGHIKCIGDLPLRSLAAAHPHLQTLHQMGCATWGQLAAMPRGGITRRFGTGLLDALDIAYGRKSETYAWLASPEVFCISHELHANVENASGLLFAASHQLKLLQAWLRARHQGVVACELTWLLDARKNTATQGQFILQTAQPTQDMKHLERLLAEHLDRIELPAPAHTLLLRSLRCEALPEVNASLLVDEQRSGEPLHCFIERVASKLGSEAISRPQMHADHRPEAAQRWVSATLTPSAAAGQQAAYSSHMYRPAWLMAQPLRLLVQGDKPYYQGVLQLIVGPERVESSCLVDAAALQTATPGNVLAHACAQAPASMARDYFMAWSAGAGLLWIFRERLVTQPGWYLHGLFA